MGTAEVLAIATKAVEVALILSLPTLLTSLVVGVIISLFQAVTQIQEQTLTFVPKLLAVMAVFLLTLPFTLDIMSRYIIDLYSTFPKIGH